jgi:hypothetical protein
MNIRCAFFFLSIFAVSCNFVTETEFGSSCAIGSFEYEKKYFTSDISGSVRFQLDESSLKNSGKVLSGSLSIMEEGSTKLVFPKGSESDCSDCIFLFHRGEYAGYKSYRAESGVLNVETLLIDTKGRVSFAKGHFSRMVFQSIESPDCMVIERIDFMFY